MSVGQDGAERLSVLLVDDHPVFRVGMANTIQKAAEVTIFEADTISLAQRILLEQPLDLAFIDISLKDENGLDLCGWITSQGFPTIPVMLSMHADKVYVEKAYQQGARGYILKDSPMELLNTVIQTFPDLEAFVTHPGLKPSVGSIEPSSKLVDKYNKLTDREKEVFGLLARGLNYKEIAFQLMIREKTASVHRYNIIQKMELGDQASIIRAAITVGVVGYHDLLHGN